jgi:hypothetical protein
MFESGFSESMGAESTDATGRIEDSAGTSTMFQDLDSSDSDNELDALDIPERCGKTRLQTPLGKEKEEVSEKVIPITTAAFTTYSAVM